MKKHAFHISIAITFLIFLIAGNLPFEVLAAPSFAGVSILVDSASKSGNPGSVVSYTLTLTNGDAVSVDLTVAATSTGGWAAPVVVPHAVTLDPGGSSDVTVNVPIPADASAGQNDITTIQVNEGAIEVATKQLTTTVTQASTTGRPLVTIASYSTGDAAIYAGREFDLSVVLKNTGQTKASNIVITFDGVEFYPRETGGVRTVGHINPGERNTVVQKFIIGESLAWQGVASLKATVVYADEAGTTYTESFTLSVKITPPVVSGSASTATPVVPLRPQLVVTSYQMDIDPLQPGSIFNLKLDVKNLGAADAKTVTVVLGGGVSAPTAGETQYPGGVSGGSGDLTNFAPLGSSNLIYIGDVTNGSVVTMNQKLVVNVSTQPGAYPLKLSFVYNDDKGNRLIDDQVITLLVYSLPQVEINFYRDAGIFTAGMENILPIQVTNLGKKTSVLGNLTVTAEGADVTNNISLVGALDAGGYFTWDANIIPLQEGSLEVKVTINYSDDFNQPRVIEQIIPVEVMPAEEYPPEMGEGYVDGMPVEPTPETFWSKVARFFKGLFGLDSGQKLLPEELIPSEETKPDQFVPVIPKG